MKTLQKIGGIIVGLIIFLSPGFYFYMWDNFDDYKKIIMLLGLIGFVVVVGIFFVYIFMRPIWNKFFGKGISHEEGS